MNALCSDTVAALRGVSKRFGSTVALERFDLEIASGELLAVLGPNGAGKSTAISLLLGLKRADAGSVTLFGRPPQDVAARRGIGVMMQEMSLPPELTVRELVALISSYYAAPLGVEATLRFAGIESVANRRYGVLSGGQKRLTQFALAVCGAPRLLFFDEPTTHLDHTARELLWERVRGLVSAGTSVVLTTHYLEEAEALADRVVVIANGRRVASGTVTEIRSVAARQRVECTTKLGVADVETWPEVSTASAVSGRLVVTTVDAVSLVARLIAADSGLRDLEVRRATLAEALALITKEHGA